MSTAKKTRARRKPASPGNAARVTVKDKREAKAVGAALEARLLRDAGERFSRTTVAIELAVMQLQDHLDTVIYEAQSADTDNDNGDINRDEWRDRTLNLVRKADVYFGMIACLSFGPIFAAHRFSGDVSAALAAGRSAGDKALVKIRRTKKQGVTAKRKAASVAAPFSTDGASEGPSEGHLRRQSVASKSVRSRTKPRHARLTGDLPQAVRGMVNRGWLTGSEAAALKLYADDFEMGCSGGPTGPGELRERVEGGRGPGDGMGRSGQAAAAWRRYLDGKALLGRRMAQAVEAVMVQGVALGGVETPYTQKDAKRAGASALLMAAGELLLRYYVEAGIILD